MIYQWKVKIIKDNVDIFSDIVFHNFNTSIFDAAFPSESKNADVIPGFKKEKPEQCWKLSSSKHFA